MKLDTSILANEAKALDTSILQEDATRNMNPEQMAMAKAQFEEEKPDLSVSRLIHGTWDSIKSGVANTARGFNLPEVFNAEHEKEMARISRDDIGIGRPFNPHEIAQIRSDIEDAQSTGVDFRTARDTAISKVAAARKEDTQKLLDAMEQNLRPSIPPTDEIHAKMLSRYKKSEILESISNSKFLEMDPEFEVTQGWVEDWFFGIGQSLPSILVTAVPYVGKVVGAPVMYAQMRGALVNSLIKEGVDPDRANNAGVISANWQTPLEFMADLFIIKKVIGSRAWTQFIGNMAQSFGIEGLTEFAQQYPEDAATLWAMNPDITPQKIWSEMLSLQELQKAAYAGVIGGLGGATMTGVGGGASILIHKYILPSQQKINEEKMTTFLSAVKKQMEGEKLTSQEQELMASVVDNLPQEAIQRMYYQTAVETENRDKIYDGLLASNLTKEQADGVITILDSIAHHYAEKTGNAPEAFYDTELVNYQVMPFSEFQQGEMREAAQSRTQYQDGGVFKVKPPKKLYRGEPEGATGSGIYSMGKGIYSTKSQSFAKKYGKIRELSPEEAFPRNPLILNASGNPSGAFTDWILRESKENNLREFNKKYQDPGEFVRSKGYDGVIVGDEIVYYGNKPSLKKGSGEIPTEAAPKSDGGYSSIKGKDVLGRDIPDWRGALVYHSTDDTGRKDITEKGYRLLGEDAEDGQGGYYGEAVSFTPDKEYSSQFGKHLSTAELPEDINILNLNDEKDWETFQKITKGLDISKFKDAIVKAGYDGVYDVGAGDLFLYAPQKARLVAFEANQPSAKTFFQTPAWHGSPHTFDKFSKDKIGTGEGAQAYGYGLYFAGKKEVAQFYKKKLSARTGDILDPDGKVVDKNTIESGTDLWWADAVIGNRYDSIEDAISYLKDKQADPGTRTNSGAEALAALKRLKDAGYSIDRPQGKLYEVDLAPEEDEYLLWDKIWDDQSEKVKTLLGKSEYWKYAEDRLEGKANRSGQNFTGADIYRDLLDDYDKKEASDFLHSLGIRGIKYLDGSSRGKGEGDYNYVIFSDDDVTIKNMYQIAKNQNPLGATTFSRFGTVITAFEGNNVSTPVHEIGHLLVDLISKYDPQNYAVITKWLGIEPERAAQGIDAWTVEEHERMAKAFETYMMEGKAPNFRTMSIFKSMKKWLLDIYRRVTKLGVKITPEIRAVFDQWLTTEEDKAMDYILDMANWSDVSSVDAGLLSADDYQTYDDVTAKARSLVAAMVKGTRDREKAESERQAMAQAEATVSEVYPDLKGKERKAAVAEEYNKLLSYIESSDEYQAKSIEDTDKIIEHELKILYAILGTSPVRGKIIGRELKKVEELNEDEIKGLKNLASDLERAAREAFEGGVKQERAAQKEKAAEKKVQTEQEIADLKKKGQEKLQAQREKNIQKAIEAKEKQKAAISKLKEQYRIRKEKQQTLRRMKKYLKKKDMLYDNRQQLFGLLARYFKVGNYKPDPEMLALEDFLAEKYPPELQAGEIIQAIVEDLPDPRRDADGNTIARNQKGKPMGIPWTLDDITKVASVADMIVEMDKTERSQQKLVEQTRRQELIDHLYTANNKQPSFLPNGEILMRPKETWFQKRKKGVKEFISELTRIEFLCQWLDNHESLGLAWERIFKPLSDAENAELRMHDNYDAQLKKIMEPFMKDGKWATEALVVPGTLTRLTRQDMFMIALNSGNKQNLAYLVKGNSVPGEVIDQIWNQELTQVEKDAVQKIWDLLDSLYPMLNEVNKKLLGVPLKKVEGHYFPIKTDHELSDVARMQNDIQTTKDLGYAPYSMAYPAHGFRKSRAETLSKYPPLLLDVSVIADHLDRSIHDITHSLPVMEVYRTINDQGVKKALRDVAGPEMYDQLLPWLRSISRPRTEAPSSLEKISRRLRKNASIVAMGLKQTVAWLQFTAMTHTADELGVKATAKGIADFFAHPWEMMEFINDKSIMMEHRGKSFDREINLMKADTIGKGGAWSKAQDLFFAQIGIMDLAAAYPTWMAAYNVGQEKFTLPDGSPDEEKIIDYADAVVRRTQGAAAAKDLPNVMKGSDFKKLWTMFYTWGNTLENRLMDLSRRTGIEGITSRQKMMAWAKGLTFLVAIPGYLGMMLYKRRLPEDEEWLTWLLAYRLSGIPYIRDISAPLVGYDFKVPMTEAWNAGSRIASDFMKVTGKVVNDEEIPWYNVAKDIGTAAGYWYGLPTSQAFVTLDGIVDLLDEKSNNPLNLLFREPRDKKEAEIY